MTLHLLPGRLAVCRLPAGDPLPAWALGHPFWSATRTPAETSVVCPVEAVPYGVRAESGWRALGVDGPLDFGLTGVLATLAAPLAAAGVPIFAVSTYDTDYLLVPEATLDRALATLETAGHRVRRDGTDPAVV